MNDLNISGHYIPYNPADKAKGLSDAHDSLLGGFDMARITKAGARAVTAELDRLADLMQDHSALFGLGNAEGRRIAMNFAARCDLMSDWIEKYAAAAESEEAKEDEVEEEDKANEDLAHAKEAADETGLSVEPAPGNQGFDANDIADKKTGPLEIITPPVESWMAGHFDQSRFSQLREKQQGGDIGFFVSAAKARLQRLAAMTSLSLLVDLLKAIHARIEASSLSDVKGLAAPVAKQITALEKLSNIHIQQSALGLVDPAVIAAAEIVTSAIQEQIPALKGILIGVDTTSPTALVAVQKSLGDVKELVSLGSSIVADAVKGLKADDVKVAKQAETEQAKDEEVKDEEKAESDAKEVKEEDEKVEQGKEAHLICGFNLFAR